MYVYMHLHTDFKNTYLYILYISSINSANMSQMLLYFNGKLLLLQSCI